MQSKIIYIIWNYEKSLTKFNYIMRKFKTIGITGASGALAKELTKIFRSKGNKVIGFTHGKNNYEINNYSPNEWIEWQCGKEFLLKEHLKKIDILILNHGIYDIRLSLIHI